MIARLTGLIIEKSAPGLVLDVQGVGYEIQLPLSCFFELPDLNETVSLFTHFVVREDAQLLYGFLSQLERTIFQTLIKINGVGPKMALTILSGMNAQQLIEAVQYEQLSALTRLPGVGKKTAERLILELKDKLKQLITSSSDSSSTSDDHPATLSVHIQEDAISALISLGYNKSQASKVIKQVYQPDIDSEALIKAALKVI